MYLLNVNCVSVIECAPSSGEHHLMHIEGQVIQFISQIGLTKYQSLLGQQLNKWKMSWNS